MVSELARGYYRTGHKYAKSTLRALRTTDTDKPSVTIDQLPQIVSSDMYKTGE